MPHPSIPDVQSAYNNASVAYGKAFEMKAFLEQASEIITENESELFNLLLQAHEKTNDAVVATREAEQAIAKLMIKVRNVS